MTFPFVGSSRLLPCQCKKKSTTLPTKYSAFWVEITGPILITVTLLQSMHGGLPAELNPHSVGLNKKAPHLLRSTVLFFLVEITGLFPITVTLLRSMHGGLPAELNPHSVSLKQKSTAPLTKCDAFVSGGDYRDRTGDLLHAMQALSQLS